MLVSFRCAGLLLKYDLPSHLPAGMPLPLLIANCRDAYQKVNALTHSPASSDLQWTQLVENTNWPSMIRLILSASWQTAFHVHYNRLPVLVHCSVSFYAVSFVTFDSRLVLFYGMQFLKLTWFTFDSFFP